MEKGPELKVMQQKQNPQIGEQCETDSFSHSLSEINSAIQLISEF